MQSAVRYSKIVQGILCLGALLACGPATVFGLGLRVPNQDATAIGRGNAFVATADNPSAIYYNPAGITQLKGNNFQVGSLFYLGIYADYDSPSGQKYQNDASVLALPTFQYTLTPEEWPVSFGFGLYEPFGFSVEWPNNIPFRQESLKGSLKYITMNPVAAWKVLPELSIGAGPTFNWSQITLVRGIFPTPIPALSDDQGKFKGDDWSYGFNAGVMWQPQEKWSFGASYRSASKMNYEGDFTLHNPPPPLQSSTVSGASSSLKFPQIVIGGVSYRPTPKWNLEFDVDWADWNSVQSLSTSGTQIPLPKTTLDWHSSFMYEFGVTHYFENGYYVSAGYFYSAVTTSSYYFNPMVPDTAYHVGSLGGGYKGETWSWALACQLIAGGYREISSSADPLVEGRYKIITPTLSFTVGYHF